MIEKLAVGPPIQGFPGMSPREGVRESAREDRSDSFSRTLEQKVTAKNSEPAKDKGLEMEKKGIQSETSKAETAPPGGPPETKRAMTAREKAIQKFMDSFESEFGIPPHKMVEAMALLEPQELNQSPEQTATSVIEKLSLPEREEERAQAMYVSLLMDLQKIDQLTPAAPRFETFEAGMTAPLMNERIQANRMRRDALNDSVERLNQNFWKTSPMRSEPLPSGQSELEALVSQSRIDDGGPHAASENLMIESAVASEVPEALLDSKGAEIGESLEAAKAPDSGRSVASEVLEKLKAEMQKLSGQSEPVKDTESLPAAPVVMTTNEGLKSSTKSAVHDPSMTQSKIESPLVAGLPPSSEAQSFSGQSGAGDSQSSSSDSEKSPSMREHQQMKAVAPMPLKLEDVAAALKNSAPMAAPATAAALSLTPADNEANVRQLMNQAQYLIKKGGGEVKVEMTPEGLGKVQMKVLLQDGKVNVQMATESTEAKKAIESSLAELRSSLAAHKLSVDHVKVDVVSGPNTESQARNDMNMNQQQGRETRQFWNQFQEQFGNRGAREGAWDLPNLKGYRKAQNPPPLAPLEAKSETAIERADGKGRGINLVA